MSVGGVSAGGVSVGGVSVGGVSSGVSTDGVSVLRITMRLHASRGIDVVVISLNPLKHT